MKCQAPPAAERINPATSSATPRATRLLVAGVAPGSATSPGAVAAGGDGEAACVLFSASGSVCARPKAKRPSIRPMFKGTLKAEPRDQSCPDRCDGEAALRPASSVLSASSSGKPSSCNPTTMTRSSSFVSQRWTRARRGLEMVSRARMRTATSRPSLKHRSSMSPTIRSSMSAKIVGTEGANGPCVAASWAHCLTWSDRSRDGAALSPSQSGGRVS
mmetsp:Transcript_6034/g.13732  ORF Transcript_6034/g.13732 Transcript_6034/m.13732 type:complete len:217 (-) Transcript_6034:131-781(-)